MNGFFLRPLPKQHHGIRASHLIVDGTKVLARDADDQRKFFPIDPAGGAPEAIRFLEPADNIIRFIDGHTAFIRRPGPNGAILVSRLDLATGIRTPVRTVTPPQEAGGGCMLQVSADGNAYTCNFNSTNSDLFLVKNLK